MGIPADSPGFDTGIPRGYIRYQTITFMKTTEVCKNPGPRGVGFDAPRGGEVYVAWTNRKIGMLEYWERKQPQTRRQGREITFCFETQFSSIPLFQFSRTCFPG
jgi:hypothetical protein